MFRNWKLFEKPENLNVTAIIAIIVAVVGSVLFGLVLGLSDWYAYTLRCMIFIPLGYSIGKDSDFDEGPVTTKRKIMTNLVYALCFTLLFLFFFGMVFPVNCLWAMAVSSIVPFVIALFAFTDWKDVEKAEEKDPSIEECPYEVEKPEFSEYPAEDSAKSPAEEPIEDPIEESDDELIEDPLGDAIEDS